jgi:hypothetical protein
MTATSVERLTEFAGLVPAKGTLGAAANKLFLKGTIVCVDADGRASPGNSTPDGLSAVGKAAATYFNRTTDPSGGAADAINVEIEYGVFGWLYTGTTPEAGQVVFVVDNQTVSTDSSSGTRGIAGYVSEVRNGFCYTLMGPTVAGQIVIAASEAAQLDTAQADIDTLQADVLELQTDATSVQSYLPVPLTGFRLSTGAAIAAFNDGVTDGFELTDSEALSLRINVASTTIFTTTVAMPPDLDDTGDVVVHFLGFRVGSSDTTAALTMNAFFHIVGSAHTQDADAITGDTSTFAAATTIVSEEIATIAAADVPAAPCSLTLTMVANAALDADDLCLTACWIEYKRALLAS